MNRLECTVCKTVEEPKLWGRAFLDRRRAFAEEHRHEEAP